MFRRLCHNQLIKFQSEGDMSTLVDFQDIWCYILKESKKVGQKEFNELSGRGLEISTFLNQSNNSDELSEGLKWRNLWHICVNFQKQNKGKLLRDAREKNRRDRVAREDYVFDQGKDEGRKEIALSMIQKKLNLSIISEITRLSEDEIKELKEKAKL